MFACAVGSLELGADGAAQVRLGARVPPLRRAQGVEAVMCRACRVVLTATRDAGDVPCETRVILAARR